MLILKELSGRCVQQLKQTRKESRKVFLYTPVMLYSRSIQETKPFMQAFTYRINQKIWGDLNIHMHTYYIVFNLIFSFVISVQSVLNCNTQPYFSIRFTIKAETT